MLVSVIYVPKRDLVPNQMIYWAYPLVAECWAHMSFSVSSFVVHIACHIARLKKSNKLKHFKANQHLIQIMKLKKNLSFNVEQFATGMSPPVPFIPI